MSCDSVADNVLASGRDNAVAIAQLGGQLQVPFGPSADEDTHIYAPIVLQHVQRFGENVFDISVGHGADLHLAVYSAKGQIIDHTSKRRNVLAFSRIDFDRENVVARPIQVRRQLETKTACIRPCTRRDRARL